MTSKQPTGKASVVLSLPVAPRIVTPLLVGMRSVPALEIPAHLPGSRDPTGCRLRIIWVGLTIKYLSWCEAEMIRNI